MYNKQSILYNTRTLKFESYALGKDVSTVHSIIANKQQIFLLASYILDMQADNLQNPWIQFSGFTYIDYKGNKEITQALDWKLASTIGESMRQQIILIQ